MLYEFCLTSDGTVDLETYNEEKPNNPRDEDVIWFLEGDILCRFFGKKCRGKQLVIRTKARLNEWYTPEDGEDNESGVYFITRDEGVMTAMLIALQLGWKLGKKIVKNRIENALNPHDKQSNPIYADLNETMDTVGNHNSASIQADLIVQTLDTNL
ncbi:MAG: hypothetical protein CMI52_04145 [Parcubacteria group bacterium]|nr:hypothetical protein [Parcubacteria group bacterium]